MRELKDYFCTYEQENELIRIGYTAKFVSLFEGLEQTENFTSGILRSQALDYFRELGYIAGLRGTTPYNWYLIERPKKSIMSIKSGNYVSHVHCESALIDKLIELEKEARNGK